MSLAEKLAQGAAEVRLALPEKTRQTLLDYLALIQKWNKVYNLTAIREPETMLSHHLLDSLAVVPHVAAAHTLIDVGSGAGLPGIPLALALPQLQVTLLESNHKKAAFLRQSAIELGLDRVEVVCERAEVWQPPSPFDVVISRAFSALPEFLAAAGQLCAKDGTIIAMKGVHPYEELAQIGGGYQLRNVLPLAVPGLAAERHLVFIQPVKQGTP
jgi:16S rRNA (guanine527-N7)-methyltransferase